ncbi:MAG TPA: FtsX-like permease family protein, partial [Thermoanaerobaculia bacterium]|nr:FtsX-like permease family protein [Thermoanaerobaculia bacterium]
QYEVQSMSAVVRVANTVSVGLLVVFIMVAGVSVVVGGVGIMNILLSSVEQRTREIGIRMSVGARRRDILQQFLLEALVLGTVGSLLGVCGGLALPLTARLLVHSIKIQVSAAATIAAFVFSCGVTVLFGLVPAYRAANMNPVEALRHE